MSCGVVSIFKLRRAELVNQRPRRLAEHVSFAIPHSNTCIPETIVVVVSLHNPDLLFLAMVPALIATKESHKAFSILEALRLGSSTAPASCSLSFPST